MRQAAVEDILFEGGDRDITPSCDESPLRYPRNAAWQGHSTGRQGWDPKTNSEDGPNPVASLLEHTPLPSATMTTQNQERALHEIWRLGSFALSWKWGPAGTWTRLEFSLTATRANLAQGAQHRDNPHGPHPSAMPRACLELKLIQHQMTQKPMLRFEGDGAPVRAANKPRSQEKKGGVCVVSHCL